VRIGSRTTTDDRITLTGAAGWLLLVLVLGFSPSVGGLDGHVDRFGPVDRIGHIGAISRIGRPRAISAANGLLELDATLSALSSALSKAESESNPENLHSQGPTGRKRQSPDRISMALDFESGGENDFLGAAPDLATTNEPTLQPSIRGGEGSLTPLLTRSRSDFSRAPPSLQG